MVTSREPSVKLAPFSILHRNRPCLDCAADIPPSKTMDDGHSYSQAELDVDLAFEMQEFDSNELAGDGLFYTDSWLLLDGQLEAYADLVEESEVPIFLNTAIRWQEHDVGATSKKLNTSKVHDRHPFLGFLSLLQNAEVGSNVFMSIPYLTDKYVIDQLCYFAKPEYGGLQIGQAKRMKEIEKENARLRRAVSDLTLDNQILQEVVRGKF